MILALEFYRSVTRYAAARAVGGRIPGVLAGPTAPLRLVTREEPRRPGDGWVPVRPLLSGICGSDLATLSGQSSLYFSPLVSTPFVPGHELVGELLEDVPGDEARPALTAGTRVVLDPVLACGPRGVEPCASCAAGHTGRCERVTVGHLAPGLQTGYCADTSGGWSKQLAAHRDQLHPVPETLSNEQAVLIEPLACAVHAVRRARIQPGQSVFVVGAGSVGLFTLLALRALTQAGRITVVAKHGRQRELAKAFDASDVVEPGRALKALRRATQAMLLRPERGSEFLLGGAEVAFEATGSRRGLDTALRGVQAGGKVVLSGLPTGGADLTPLWFRELELVGAYATDSGDPPDGCGSDFAVATELVDDVRLDGFVGGVYALARWRDALDHAFSAGKLGTLKVAFDPTQD